MKKVDSFRKKYPRFIYENFRIKLLKSNLKIVFDFRIPPDIHFKPEIIIKGIKQSQIKRVGEKVINNLAFHLGLIEMLSYWKATVSPGILIKTGKLNKEQLQWWRKLILKGMGQFFYENKIDFRQTNFLKIDVFEVSPRTMRNLNKDLSKNKVLVPIGGGKDSIVTLELLKRNKQKIQCFSLNPTRAAKKIMKIADHQKPIIIERKIDKTLLELNKKGYLNGHTPFSAYLAFLSVLVAILFEIKYIAFSNERSSNEGNVKYLGSIVNHQWSKSFEFEKMFRDYSKKYLAKDVEYFSFLRSLYEIQIAKIFSHFVEYFPIFLSCNEPFKKKTPNYGWCGKCPKCLFVFTILYPFVKESQLLKIFGQNLFEDPEGVASRRPYGASKKLLPLMQQLIGERGFKPFECVGTKKESLVAFYLSWKKVKQREQFSLLRYFEKEVLPKYSNLQKESKIILNSWNHNNFLPKNLAKILKKSF